MIKSLKVRIATKIIFLIQIRIKDDLIPPFSLERIFIIMQESSKTEEV